MERSDERLSTRDIASPTSADDARFERDEPAADHAVTDDTMATMADPAAAAAERQPDRDMRDPADDAGEPATADPGTTEPAAATATTTGTNGTSDVDDAAPLLPDGEGFQSRWEEIQVRFPRERPAEPVIGAGWWDEANHSLCVWDGRQWVCVPVD